MNVSVKSGLWSFHHRKPRSLLISLSNYSQESLKIEQGNDFPVCKKRLILVSAASATFFTMFVMMMSATTATFFTMFVVMMSTATAAIFAMFVIVVATTATTFA